MCGHKATAETYIQAKFDTNCGKRQIVHVGAVDFKEFYLVDYQIFYEAYSNMIRTTVRKMSLLGHLTGEAVMLLHGEERWNNQT